MSSDEEDEYSLNEEDLLFLSLLTNYSRYNGDDDDDDDDIFEDESEGDYWYNSYGYDNGNDDDDDDDDDDDIFEEFNMMFNIVNILEFDNERRRNKKNEICKFYLMGTCKYGNSCLYSHKNSNIKEEEEKKETLTSKNNEICKFYKMGFCKYGKFCSYLHEESEENGIINEFNEKNIIEKKKEEEEEEEDNENKILKERKRDHLDNNNNYCGICLEKVGYKSSSLSSSSLSSSSSRFGLLENCDHKFCLPCIMKWRKQRIENSKKCPLCRKKSHFVIPSNKYFIGDEKIEMIKIYKEKSKGIQCKFETLGNCAFGKNCFFKHTK